MQSQSFKDQRDMVQHSNLRGAAWCIQTIFFFTLMVWDNQVNNLGFLIGVYKPTQSAQDGLKPHPAPLVGWVEKLIGKCHCKDPKVNRTNMVEPDFEPVEAVVTFDIFDSLFASDENVTELKLTQEERERLDTFFDMMDCAVLQQKDNESEDFQRDANTSMKWFLKATSDDLDKLEFQEYEKLTHWQTAWAVRVFKGKFNIFSVKNSPEITLLIV